MDYLIVSLLMIWGMIGACLIYKYGIQWIINKDIEYNGEEILDEWKNTMSLKEQSNILTTYYRNQKTQKEIAEVFDLIDEAVHNGKYEVCVEGTYNKIFIKHMKKEGFKVKYHKYYDYCEPFFYEYYIISWR